MADIDDAGGGSPVSVLASAEALSAANNAGVSGRKQNKGRPMTASAPKVRSAGS